MPMHNQLEHAFHCEILFPPITRKITIYAIYIHICIAQSVDDMAP